MKKNLKTCIEQPRFSDPVCVIDMNDYQKIESCGLIPDLKHKKSAHMSAGWKFADRTRVRIPLDNPDLSAYRFLTFSVFAAEGCGGSFHIRFESDAEAEGESGYSQTLPICRNGWNDYRLELPFLHARGSIRGWDHIRAVVLDCAIGGQANKTETRLAIDSFYAWEASAPQIYVKMPELKGAAMFSKTAAYAVVDRKRIPIAPDSDPNARPFEQNNILWLPLAPIAAILGHRAIADNKAITLSFTYRRQSYVFYGNSTTYLCNGESAELPFRPAVRGGSLFFPMEFVRDFFRWRQCFTDPNGLVILSNRKSIFECGRDEDILWQLNAELTFVQPTAEEILEDLHRKIPNPDKGRLLLLPEEWMALRKLSKTDDFLRSMLDTWKTAYGTTSEIFRSEPVLANGVPEGTVLSDALSNASARILGFSSLFRLTGDKKYAERAGLECESLAALSSWDAEHSILTAARTGYAMAIGYDWCHTAWSEGKKALFERTMLRYAMRPAVEAYNGRLRMWRVGSAESAEINCSILALALSLSDIYPETSLKLLRHVLRNLTPSFAAYAPDGGYAEGVGAWERATRSLVLSIAMLESATGKSYGLSNAPGFASTARFPIYTETENGAWNYHDRSDAPIDTAVLGWFAGYTGNESYAWLRRRDLLSGKKLPNLLDFVWYRPVAEDQSPAFPLDSLYRRAGLVSFRTGFSAEDTFFGIHGGKNNERGGELDAGSFLLEMGGERFFVELGGCDALPVMLRRRAEGQNTIAIDPPDEPMPDQNPDAIVPIVAARSSEGHAYAVLELSSISDKLLRGKRGILLTGNRSVAVVQDELTLSEPALVVWNAYTRASIRHLSARTVILEQNGKLLLCRLNGAGGARFEAIPVGADNLTRLAVSANADGKFRMSVACKLYRDDEDRNERFYEPKPISSWEI